MEEYEDINYQDVTNVLAQLQTAHFRLSTFCTYEAEKWRINASLTEQYIPQLYRSKVMFLLRRWGISPNINLLMLYSVLFIFLGMRTLLSSFLKQAGLPNDVISSSVFASVFFVCGIYCLFFVSFVYKLRLRRLYGRMLQSQVKQAHLIMSDMEEVESDLRSYLRMAWSD